LKSTDVLEEYVASICRAEEEAIFLPSLFFDPEVGGDMFLRNVGIRPTDYMALYSRR
jgi:hypothetical protein